MARSLNHATSTSLAKNGTLIVAGLNIFGAFHRKIGLLFLSAFLFSAGYYCVQIGLLIVRFSELPNYVNTYPWLSNVIRIFESTPSIKDSLLIFKDEWIVEIGFMNYSFGKGISEWSLFIAPAKLAVLYLANLIIAANLVIYFELRKKCNLKRPAMLCVGSGAASLFAATSITMSWVVCCSTPTWVVGLSILGLGVSTALWLEPLGVWLNVLGLCLLIYILVEQLKKWASENTQMQTNIQTSTS